MIGYVRSGLVIASGFTDDKFVEKFKCMFQIKHSCRDDVNDCGTATRFRFGDQCFAHLECFLVDAFDDSCEFHFDVLRHDDGCDRRNFDGDRFLNPF